MARACHIAVRSATGDVFSDDEIDDFLDRVASQARRARKDAPTLTEREAIAAAAQAVTKDALKEALTAKRLRVAADLARETRRAKIDGFPARMTPAQRLEAVNVGSERQGLGTSSSIDAEGRARQMQLWGQVERGLAVMPGLKDRLSNFWGLAETGFTRKVAAEMARLNGGAGIEPTGDEGALHAAQVLVKAISDAREMQNSVGAFIEKIPGYIGRQSHDPGKVAGGFWRELGEVGRRAQAAKGLGGLKDLDWGAARSAAEARAFGAWRDFILPKLDPATFAGLELEDIPFEKWEDEAEEARQMSRRRQVDAAKQLQASGIVKDATDVKELMLYRVWSDIVSGRHAEMTGGDDLGDFKPKASLARSVSKARVLHFTGPDAWMDYNEKYGRGGLFAGVMGQLERAGRNAALMKVWGPAPDAAFSAEIDRLAAEAKARGQVSQAKALNDPMVRARFEAVNGMAEAPENMRFAQVMRTLRGWEALTKLGSIVLSKTTDLPIMAGVFKRVGGSWLGGYKSGFFDGLLKLGSEDQKAAADALDVGARSFSGHIGAQYLASDGPPGWTGWATRLMYRINMFEGMNNAFRHGAAEGYSRILGQEAAKGWDDLNIGTRETFERFGVQPADWEMVRHGLEAAPDGRTYFTLDHLERQAQARPNQARAIDATKLKFQTMIHNMLDDVVSEPRARERSGMTRGTRAGTLLGEFDRSFFQFKGFINTIVGRHLVPASRGYAGYSPVSLLAHFILGTALAGYVSSQAKTISRGEVPKPLIGGSIGDTLKIWGQALAQGGGLGLYGDFLFGELNRNGSDFDWGQLGGPIIGDSETVAKIVRQAISGGAVNESTGRSQIPGELVKLGSSNIPLVNLWYTRLALDYLVLWRLQEAVSPGYLQRYEDRVRNQEHSDFLLAPTSAAA